MKTIKKWCVLVLGLFASSTSYSNIEVDLHPKEKILLMMIEEGFIIPSVAGVELTDEGLSILDELESEGRLEAFESKVATICIGFGEN